MTKISLATYTIKVKEKKKFNLYDDKDKLPSSDDEYLKLDNLGFTTLDDHNKPQTVFGILTDFFYSKPPGFTHKNRAITIINDFDGDEEQAILFGTLHYGTYGSAQPVIDIDTEDFEESETVRIGKRDCPVIPYYFLIKLPQGRKEGLVIFEKKGVYGIKTTFEEWLKAYLSENNINLEFIISPFTPEEVIKKYAEEGGIRELRYLSYTLPSEEIEILRDYGPKEGYYEMRFVFPKHAENLKKVPSKLKNLLLGHKNAEIQDKMLGGLEPDDIKIKVVLDGNARTFTISNPTKAAPYRDISMEIKPGEDGHPDFESIHGIAMKYANEIFK